MNTEYKNGIWTLNISDGYYVRIYKMLTGGYDYALVNNKGKFPVEEQKQHAATLQDAIDCSRTLLKYAESIKAAIAIANANEKYQGEFDKNATYTGGEVVFKDKAYHLVVDGKVLGLGK